jgi:hypothetical protein
MMQFKRVIPLVTALTGLVGCAPEPPETPPTPEAPPLVGAWRLVSWEQRYDDGTVDYPYGPDAIGQIAYGPGGNMSAIVIRKGVPRFASGDLLNGTDAEVRAAYEGLLSYYGTYTVNTEEKSVTHHVEGCSFPNWIGMGLTRFYAFEGTRLTLSTPSFLFGGRPGVGVITWERFE